MIKYDWGKIERICNYDRVNILHYFYLKEKIWIPSYLPKKFEHKVYLKSKELYPIGNSYMLNIVSLLKNEEHCTIDQVYNYLLLASMRPHFEYKIRGVNTLPVIIAEAINLDLNNPLIKIANDKIYFKYETDETEE